MFRSRLKSCTLITCHFDTLAQYSRNAENSVLGLFYFRGGDARPAAVVKVFLYPAGYKIVFMIVGVSVYAGLVLSKQSGVVFNKSFS